MSNGIQEATPIGDGGVFYEAFTATSIGIAVENLQGQPLFVNPALCSMLGFTEAEMRGKRCVEFSPAEDAEKDWALFQQLRAGSIDQYQIDKRFFRGDGSVMWGRLRVSLLHRNGEMVVAMVEDITERKTAEQALADLSRKMVEILEQERTRIARDLHDDINQRLALLAFEIDQLKQPQLGSADDLVSRLNGLRERINEVSIGVQFISHELYPPQLEYLGVVAALRDFCKNLAERQKVEIDFKSEEIVKPVVQDVSLCLLRVLQEGLHNATKHSHVRHFAVRLHALPNQLRLTISDQGTGFDTESAANKNGLGLVSMRERVRLVNGTITINSKPMAGTSIDVRVPLKLPTESLTVDAR